MQIFDQTRIVAQFAAAADSKAPPPPIPRPTPSDFGQLAVLQHGHAGWDEKSWDEVELPQLIKTPEQLMAEEEEESDKEGIPGAQLDFSGLDNAPCREFVEKKISPPGATNRLIQGHGMSNGPSAMKKWTEPACSPSFKAKG